MVATVLIIRTTSGSTETDITSGNTRASTSDDPSQGTATPIPVPAANENFSFWVTTQLQVTVAPTTVIDNIRFYSDGANGLGTGVFMVANKTSTYIEASGTISTTGLQLTTALHTNLFSAAQDIFSFTSTAPLTLLGTLSVTGSSGSSLVVYQIIVSSGAGAGTTPAETLTYLFDET